MKLENIQHRTSNIEHPTSNVWTGSTGAAAMLWMLDVGCWLLDVRIRKTRRADLSGGSRSRFPEKASAPARQ
jgi:hypothetical protein